MRPKTALRCYSGAEAKNLPRGANWREFVSRDYGFTVMEWRSKGNGEVTTGVEKPTVWFGCCGAWAGAFAGKPRSHTFGVLLVGAELSVDA